MPTVSGRTRRIKLKGGDIRIALTNENSQGAKSGMIYNSLEKVANQHGFEVDSYDMYAAEDEAQLTYVQVGVLVAALLNAKATDYVTIGCGIDEGTILACSPSPGVIYGHVGDTLDAYIFAQINDGGVVAIPFAKGFGWDGDLNLEYIFEKLFCEPSGQGYPRERVIPEQRNKRTLGDMRKASSGKGLVEILKELDQELVRGVLSGEKFGELLFGKCKDERLAAYIKGLIG